MHQMSGQRQQSHQANHPSAKDRIPPSAARAHFVSRSLQGEEKGTDVKTRYGPHGISGVLIRACFGIARTPDQSSATARRLKKKDAAPDTAAATTTAPTVRTRNNKG
jgi:hypothetical protein